MSLVANISNDLSQFMERLDAAAETFLEPHDANGHKDLPDYDPRMGPRYSVKGYQFPLSVFRGEGIALFLIARALRPQVIAECYTGTGYAACCLAAGAPDAEVYTVDVYSEGGLSEQGVKNATAMRDALRLNNLSCLHGTVETVRQAMKSPANLYLSDGPYEGAPLLADDAVHIRHDDTQGRVDGRAILIEGGSHMNVTCPTVEMREWLIGELRPFVKVRAI
jgi:hypothetical protein